jgi:tetratricopeptide (TPR) repeat protein
MGLRTVPRDHDRPRISLCMIMRDEEAHLARCLTSVRDAVDEIVIVDTGSVDRSVAIAERFGARVLHEEWRGDFAAPRNTAIDAASGDWILVLDADEEVVGAHALRELVSAEGVEGWSLREVNFIGEERGIDSVVMSAFRLFRNRPEYRYEGALHEQVMGRVAHGGHGEMRFADIEIHHYGYLEPTSRAKRKSDRNMAIVMEEVRRRPDDPFTLFNAGVEHQRVGRHEEALEYFSRSFENLDSLAVYYASLLVRNIVASLHMTGRDDEALDVLADGLQAYPDFADLHHLEGRVLMQRREYRAAARSFRRAIEIGEHGGDRYLTQTGMGSFYALSGLGVLHQLMGDRGEAARCFRRAIEAADGFFPAPVMALTRLLLDTDPPDAVLAYMSKLVSERRRGDALCLIAEALLERGHPEQARAALHEARACGADEGAVRLQLAEAALRLGDLAQARAELAAIAPGTPSHPRAVASRVVVEVLDGDPPAALAAVGELARVSADTAVPAAYRRVIAAHGGACRGDEPVADADRPAVLDALFSLAGSMLAIGRLDTFNLTVPLLYEVAASAGEVDGRLGRLLLREGFIEPAAERLLAAVGAGDPGADVFGDLGRICEHRDMPDDAEAFYIEARDRDPQNISRYLDLAGLLAGRGRFADADGVLRQGLIMHPYSSVLGELRDAMSLFARA